MNDKHVLNELSAYLDGECPAQKRVARHLERCPDCARRYKELAALSARVRRLPAPDVRPEFTARVVASIEESAPAPRRRSGRLAAPLAIAALVLFVAVTATRFARTPSTPAPPAPTFPSEAVLLAELERRISDGDNAATWEAPEPSDGWPEEDIADDEWLDVLACADWFDTVAEVLEADADLDAVIFALGEDEALALKELLNECVEQGWPT